MLILTSVLTGCTTVKSPTTETQPEAVPQPTNVVEEVLTETEAKAYEAERAVALANNQALEVLAETEENKPLSTSEFVGIAPGHNTEGTVTVTDLGDNVLLEFSDDFVADKGPDLYVTLTQEQPLTGEDPVQLDTSKVKTITPLLHQSGGQRYAVPKADFESYGHAVVVWCKKYNVVFGAALLP